MAHDIEVITIVQGSSIHWKAIDHNTGLEETGPTPSKAESNLRTKINRMWRELEKGKTNA